MLDSDKHVHLGKNVLTSDGTTVLRVLPERTLLSQKEKGLERKYMTGKVNCSDSYHRYLNAIKSLCIGWLMVA